MVSVAAQRNDSKALAWGNVVGSNIFNLGMVLGLCGLISPLAIAGSTVRLEFPFMLGSGLLVALLVRSSNGHHELDRLEGTFFLVLFILFTAFMIRLARKEVDQEERTRLREAVSDAAGDVGPTASLRRSVAFIVLGCVSLAFGGSSLVDGAESLALHMKVSPRVVATVIVAALTGAPELVTTLAALLHKKGEMAVANVVGSNIFNTLMVLGVASTIRPLEIAQDGLLTDLAFMVGISALLGPLLLGKRLYRWEGVTLLTVYATYVGFLLTRASHS